MKPLLNLLGFSQRAGKLVSGEQEVLKAIRSNKAKVVLISSDTGHNTRKSVKDKCRFYHVPVKEDCFTSDDLSHALGKKRFICALTEQGFAKKIMTYIK